MVIVGTYEPALVALSVLIAMAASYTALDLASRVRASGGHTRMAWLATAALAMGGGIWAMHFVGMLAFRMAGMDVAYHVGLTCLSLLVPVLVTGAAFFVMSQPRRTAAPLLASGLFMGLGIAAMHYMGMAAMEMPARLHYEPGWVVLSILIAIGAATVALVVADRDNRTRIQLISAIPMGIAIAGMHYAGMRGAVFTPSVIVQAPAILPGAVLPSAIMPGMAPGAVMSDAMMPVGDGNLTATTLALAVAASTFLILALALVAAMFDRRFALLAERDAKALRDSEERFRSLYTRTPLPLHSLDEAGRIEFVTDAWLALLGYARDAVIGRPLVNFLTEASARQAIQDDWPALLATGEMREAEYRAVTRSGQFLDVVASARVERGANGAFLRVLGGLTNITERKRAEEALRQAQKMEAIGQLTGGVAHDFNNLLAVVLGNLELLTRRLPDDARAQRYLENALQGVQRGAGLTQRLLAFARKQHLAPEQVDVPALVGGMADLLQRSLGPMVRIDTHFPPHLSRAQVDANQLELVVLNLALNARDAMPEGGTLVLTAVEHVVAAGEGLAAGGYICLAVTDDGIGMDEPTLARAMEPFFTTKGVGKGTGLGLPMAQGLAAQSGGRLLLHSTPGKGTTAELWLPAVAQSSESGATAAADPPPAMRETTPLVILAVDDDPLVLANTVAMLEDLGHDVVAAASGPDALARLREGVRVDLVITDQAMPSMTGLQLIAIVRQDQPWLPVLVVSGYAELPEGSDSGLRVLTKPFRQAALAQALHEIVSTRPTAEILPLQRRS